MKITLTQPLYSLPYSLHDGYLTKLEADEETLVCHFPYGIFSTAAPCQQTAGAKVILTGVDWDASFLYVFERLSPPFGTAGGHRRNIWLLADKMERSVDKGRETGGVYNGGLLQRGNGV